MEDNWNLKNYVYRSEISVDDIINSIRVFELLKEKYPNDDVVYISIEILRNEICKMFGGSIYDIE
jgi:hypothetical protein